MSSYSQLENKNFTKKKGSTMNQSDALIAEEQENNKTTEDNSIV